MLGFDYFELGFIHSPLKAKEFKVSDLCCLSLSPTINSLHF